MSAAVRNLPESAMPASAAAATPAGLPGNWPNREHSRFVHTRRGMLHVQRTGSGPPILLVHGTGAATHTWRGLLPRLANRFDVLAFDLPGHGWSEPADSMTLDSLADATSALLSQVDFTPEFIVGHSAGAAVAVQTALTLSAGSPKIIGINAALEPFGGALAGLFSPLARVAAATPLLTELVCRRARHRSTVDRMLRSTGSALSPAAVAEYQEVLRRPTHVRATMQMMAQWNLEPLRARLERVAARMHLLACTGDRAVPVAQARRIRAEHPSMQLTVWHGPGHLVHEEDPARVAEWILALPAAPGAADD